MLALGLLAYSAAIAACADRAPGQVSGQPGAANGSIRL